MAILKTNFYLLYKKKKGNKNLFYFLLFSLFIIRSWLCSGSWKAVIASIVRRESSIYILLHYIVWLYKVGCIFFVFLSTWKVCCYVPVMEFQTATTETSVTVKINYKRAKKEKIIFSFKIKQNVVQLNLRKLVFISVWHSFVVNIENKKFRFRWNIFLFA